MKESLWGALIVGLGVVAIAFIFFFQSLTNTDEHNYNLLRETAEAAMYDAFDLASFREYDIVRIDREKFVENFVRRFAENANLSRTYVIDIYDVNEEPPKVSLKVSSVEKSNVTNPFGTSAVVLDFDIQNRLDAILEVPYSWNY
jgi:hypothetical protein